MGGESLCAAGACARDDAEGGPRFGFTVSSRALMAPAEGGVKKRPGAVMRNRARRRLKEAVRLAALHLTAD